MTTVSNGLVIQQSSFCRHQHLTHFMQIVFLYNLQMCQSCAIESHDLFVSLSLACLSVKHEAFMGVLMGAQLVGLYEYLLGIIILRLFRIHIYADAIILTADYCTSAVVSLS